MTSFQLAWSVKLCNSELVIYNFVYSFFLTLQLNVIVLVYSFQILLLLLLLLLLFKKFKLFRVTVHEFHGSRNFTRFGIVRNTCKLENTLAWLFAWQAIERSGTWLGNFIQTFSNSFLKNARKAKWMWVALKVFLINHRKLYFESHSIVFHHSIRATTVTTKEKNCGTSWAAA